MVGESGDWLSVIPMVVPVEAALRHLADLLAKHSPPPSNTQVLWKKPTTRESPDDREARLFETVAREARLGPIAGGKGTEEPMWALRRQGDMMYLVSERTGRSVESCRRACYLTAVWEQGLIAVGSERERVTKRATEERCRFCLCVFIAFCCWRTSMSVLEWLIKAWSAGIQRPDSRLLFGTEVAKSRHDWLSTHQLSRLSAAVCAIPRSLHF